MPDHATSVLLEQALDRPFTFQERAVPMPAEYRPRWRTSLLVLLLGACHGARASWHQLHFLSWTSRSTANQEAFLRWKNGEPRLDDALIRYDPSLDRAIDLALFDGLIERRTGDVLALTAHGKQVLKELKHASVFEAEQQFLSGISPVTQGLVDSLMKASS
jgi:hypothetical protein